MYNLNVWIPNHVCSKEEFKELEIRRFQYVSILNDIILNDDNFLHKSVVRKSEIFK